jgi:ribosomal protein S18 acetylase RimI-like enzyme
MISYTDTIHDITPEHVQGFFVGWPNPPSPATHLSILAGSAAVVLAREDATGHVVGFITAISDGVSCAYIPHLEVLPAYQGQGIGSELVQRMLVRLRHLYMIDLICDIDVQPFYERLGMRPFTGMILRNYDRQSGAQ